MFTPEAFDRSRTHAGVVTNALISVMDFSAMPPFQWTYVALFIAV